MSLDDDAMIEFTGKEMIIRITGNELIREITCIKASIPQALEAMKKEALQQPIITEGLDDYLDSLEEDDVCTG